MLSFLESVFALALPSWVCRRVTSEEENVPAIVWVDARRMQVSYAVNEMDYLSDEHVARIVFHELAHVIGHIVRAAKDSELAASMVGDILYRLYYHYPQSMVCRKCGKPVNLPWVADDDVYAEFSGGENVLCIDCFYGNAEGNLNLSVKDGVVVASRRSGGNDDSYQD